MKAPLLLSSTLGVLLAGCINTPQTKALITPVGVVGIHSFAPPREQPPPSKEFERKEFERRIAQQAETFSAEHHDRS